MWDIDKVLIDLALLWLVRDLIPVRVDIFEAILILVLVHKQYLVSLDEEMKSRKKLVVCGMPLFSDSMD